jgi:hypothetical protein
LTAIGTLPANAVVTKITVNVTAPYIAAKALIIQDNTGAPVVLMSDAMLNLQAVGMYYIDTYFSAGTDKVLNANLSETFLAFALISSP